MTPQTAAQPALLSMGLSRQETGVGCHFLFHRIFPAQGSKVHFLQMDSLPLNHLGQAVFPKSLPRIFFPSQQLLKTPYPLSPSPKSFSSPVFSHAKQSTSAIGSSHPPNLSCGDLTSAGWVTPASALGWRQVLIPLPAPRWAPVRFPEGSRFLFRLLN